MRKIIFVIITVVALALSGCASETELPPIDTAELTEPTYESAEPVDAPEAPAIDLSDVSRGAYLDTLGDEFPWLTEAQMLDFADLACAMLELGATPVEAAFDIADTRAQLDDYTAAAVVGSAIGSAYCENAWS